MDEGLATSEQQAFARGAADAASAANPADEVVGNDNLAPRAQTWLRLAQPATLPLSLGSGVIALLLLWQQGQALSVPLALAGLVAVALIHLGGNMLDEYLEFARYSSAWAGALGTSADERPMLAHSRVYPLDALRVSIGLLALGALCGVPLVLAGGAVVGLLGVLGLAGAVLYSSTSYALKRLAIGDLAVLLAFGPVILSIQMLAQHHQLTARDLIFGLAVGCCALAVVEAIHLRDAASDGLLGRKTVTVLLGLRAGRAIYALTLLAAYLLVALAALPGGAPHTALLVFLSLPAALIALTGGLRAHPGGARELVVRQVLRVNILFVLTLGLGLVLDGLYLHVIAPLFS